MKFLWREISLRLNGDTPLALVTVTDQEGSAPRGSGAAMLVCPDGAISGTVGGGRYEGESIGVALELLAAGAAKAAPSPGALLEYSLRGVTDMDMICGGSLRLLVQILPCAPGERALFGAVLAAEEARRPFVFISRFAALPGGAAAARQRAPEAAAARALTGGALCGRRSEVLTERFIHLPGETSGVSGQSPLPEEIIRLAENMPGKAAMRVSSDNCQYLLEYHPAPRRLVLFGAGHVSRELAHLAARLDFQIIVIDDRPEFANAARFPAARIFTPPGLTEADSAACLKGLLLGPDDALAVITRGHSHDRDALAAALGTRAGYIGMIGSKSKRAAVYENLERGGIAREKLAAVHSPIGLSIGAQSPAEIAVSIAAELIAWSNAQAKRS